MKKTGMIHIYTGNGKGKTTAALGLALRAAGAGMKVFFAQFIKAGRTSEADAISRHLPMMAFKSFGRGRFIRGEPSARDITDAGKALEECSLVAASGEFGLVVLDEIFPALRAGLIREEDLKGLILRKSPETEMVLTGRGASASMVAAADLVTEMKEVRHYYREGVKARKGIEL